jgi:antitoxin HicB
MNKTVDDYMSLPYIIELQPDPKEGWFVRVKELPGCMSQGDTAEEAVQMIQDAMRGWLEVALEAGNPIPEPRPEEDYSGKFVVRVPRSLHRELVEAADREGVSLNQYINVALAQSVGQPAAQPVSATEPSWPGLAASMRQVLQAAGMAQEAGELDERLFTHHLEQMINQLESAVQSKKWSEASDSLVDIDEALSNGTRASPILGVFRRVVGVLDRQMDVMNVIRQIGVMDEVQLQSQVTRRVSDVSAAMAEDLMRQVSADFSKASMEPRVLREYAPRTAGG